MNWLTSGIETNVAYGTCMLLFGLLVLSLRNRKMAARSSQTFYSSPLRGTIPPAPKNKSEQGLRSATTPGHYSGLLLSTGPEYAPCGRENIKPPESSAKRLDAPLDFPAPHISDEVKMDPPSFQLGNRDPIAPAENFALAAPATTSTVREDIPSPPAVQSLVKIEERRAQEIAIATDPHMANENPSDMSVVSEQRRMKTSATNPQAPPVATGREKTAAAKLLAFYGLQQQPFDVTPDPAFLYFSPSHREALTSLKQGIEYFRGFIMLVAEPGMGKTTLLNKLMEELSDSAQVVFLFQTQCSSRELLCFILNELEVDHAGMGAVAMHRALNQALLEEMLRGRRFVLVVDEAQNLQEPVLETIRLLSDFETTHSKLIQIVLAGQPQLADTLMRPCLVQLRQRIAVLSDLKPLSAVETAEYIEHRLRASGWSGGLLFTNDAVAQIAESSEGIPRSINNLCFNALLEAFHRGLKVIDADIVDEVADKLDLEALVRRPQMDLVSQQPAAPADAIGASKFARALAAALNAEAWPDVNSEPNIAPKPKSS